MSSKPGNIPSLIDITFSQINNAQMAIHAVTPFLFAETRTRPEGLGGQKDPGDEVTDSAITTFVKACNVLDKLLDDKARWSAERYEGLEKALESVYRQQAHLIAAETSAADARAQALHMTSRPSALLKPKIYKRKDGTIVMQYQILKGVGKTIAEAALDFDSNYFGLTKEQPPQ